MEAFFVSIGAVALAEIGDKTQLLAFILATRFKQPIPIIVGIVLATLINHSLAGAVGIWITTVVSPSILRWVLGGSFLIMAIWTLIPDSMAEEQSFSGHKLGIFGATFITFFLAEMGDKTQIATVGLAAHYGTPWLVIAGTTIGMLIADVPAVLIGNQFAHRLPMKWIRVVAAGIFAVIGLIILVAIEDW